MSNSIAPGSSADVNVKVTALTTNPNVPVTYKTIILKKNLVNGVNTLTQEMMSAQNTKYVIKYNYILGENVTVPANCVLEFDGGSISGNGTGKDTITGNRTKINENVSYEIFKNVTPIGFSFPYLKPQWFGAKADYNEQTNTGTDDSSAFAKCTELIGMYYNGHYIYLNGSFYISNTVTTPYDINIKGNHVIERRHGQDTYSNPSSPSLIHVADNTIAFVQTGLKGGTYNYGYINVRDCKVSGNGINSGSIFIKNQAGGAPSRVSSVINVAFDKLGKCMELEGSFVLGNITVDRVTAYSCGKFINTLNGAKQTTNLLIQNSTIEDCGENSINLYDVFGYTGIINNILEGTICPIKVGLNQDSIIEIRGNYFEVNTGCANIDGKAVLYKAKLIFKDNHIEHGSVTNVLTAKFVMVDADLYTLDNASSFEDCLILTNATDFNPTWIKKNSVCMFKERNIARKATADKNEVLVNNVIPGTIIPTNYVFINAPIDTSEQVYMVWYMNAAYLSIGYTDGNGSGSSVPFRNPFNDVICISRIDRYPGSYTFLVISYEESVNIGGLCAYSENTISMISALTLPDKNNIISSMRPSYSKDSGCCVFDTAINKPLYWNGTAWVDATGTPV